MKSLSIDIPTIAITGSSGKTTTREFIASILETKWKILKTHDNKNLPIHTKKTLECLNSTHKAILLELGMGKPGAAEKHCSIIQPNISIITNIGTAHFGNLGNSIESTASYKSALITHMKPKGLLLINRDDKNSELLKSKDFKGEIVTVAIHNKADYIASKIKYKDNGMSFEVKLGENNEAFFIPTLGEHNILNALFAIAISHHLKFTPSEIRLGLKNFITPIKRQNIIELINDSLLIDDTVNANPQSVKAAIDVLSNISKKRKRIVILGSMLELGDYCKMGHIEVGQYLAKKKADAIYTYGDEALWIQKGAIDAGFSKEKTKHFNTRNEIQIALKNIIKSENVVLVKGSSSMGMDLIARYIRNTFKYTIKLEESINDSILLSSKTLEKMNISTDIITLHFGAFKKELIIKIDNNLELYKFVIPKKLTNDISIPDLPYNCYFEEGDLYLGPVIGMLIYPRYYEDPKQQILRFSNYDEIMGLIFLFKRASINKDNLTITGYYYNPKTKEFVLGTFPYPSVIFNRVPIKPSLYKHLVEHIGENIFNYPYGNTNKWAFWQQMIKQPTIKKHLPKTEKYLDVNNLEIMLRKFNSLYLKPTTLAGGRGILFLEKSTKGYLLSDLTGNQQIIDCKKNLSIELNKRFIKNKKYIIQQAIPFYHQGEKIDFRVYFQKSQDKKWIFSGMETKVSNDGSIITNSNNRKKIIPGKTALKEIYKLNEDQIESKIKEITKICVRILKVMEKYGSHIGDTAVDMIIDRNHKIWILEVQLNYAAEIKALREKDEQVILPAILPTPFEYAKSLTVFK